MSDEIIKIHSDEESIYDDDFLIVNDTRYSLISEGPANDNGISSSRTRDSQATPEFSTETTIDTATMQEDAPTKPPRSIVSGEMIHVHSNESPDSADSKETCNPCVNDVVFAEPSLMAGKQSPCSPNPAEKPDLSSSLYCHNRVGVIEKAISILASKASTRGSQGEVDPSKTLPLFLFGANVVGKTGLASVIVRDPRFQRSFPKGVHWVTVGWRGTMANDYAARLQTSLRVHTCLRTLADELLTPTTDDQQAAASPHRPATVEEFIRRFALFNASCGDDDAKRLVVLDDVWEVEIIEAFHRAKFVLLVTTNEIENDYTAFIDALPVSWTRSLDKTMLLLNETAQGERRREATFTTTPAKKPRLKVEYGCYGMFQMRL